jgi:hypothetical protein
MKPAKPDPAVPTRLVATWSAATLNTAGQASKRGFGGRLIFFKDEQQDPVRVEGQLVVYAYDETQPSSPGAAPTRRYVITPEQFGKQEGASSLGPYYSVWLPWDDVGGPQKKISLITRFEPKDGPILLGEQTQHLLPGVELPKAETAIAAAPASLATPSPSTANIASGRVELAGFNGQADGQAQPAQPIDPLATATINLPRRLGEAMQSAPYHPTPFPQQTGVRNTTVKTATFPPAEASTNPAIPAAANSTQAAMAPPAVPSMSAGSLPATRPAQAAQAAPLMPARGQYLQSLEASPLGRRSESARRP